MEGQRAGLPQARPDGHPQLLPIALSPHGAAPVARPGLPLQQRSASAGPRRPGVAEEVRRQQADDLPTRRRRPVGRRRARPLAASRPGAGQGRRPARQSHLLRDLCTPNPPRAAPLQRGLGQGRRPLPQPRRRRARRLRHTTNCLLCRPAALPGRRRVGSSVFKCGTAGFSRSNGSFRPLFALKNGRTDAFVAQVRQDITEALADLDRTLPQNPHVQILPKAGGWIALSKLEAQPEPENILALKADLAARWPMTGLLDMLKETDLRVGFSDAFRGPTAFESMDRGTLQQRLLLCLYGLGTNTGLKRMSAEEHSATYKDHLYVRRRFLTRDQLRNAITQVVNAIFRVRLPQIWGEGTTRRVPPTPRSSVPGIRT